jgi:hypothetical protein
VSDTDHATLAGAPPVDSIHKKGGKVTATQTSVISADGKTRTVTTKGADAAGKSLNNVAVYDRQ